MNNFGVIEIAVGKTSAAPGWAYVADTAPARQATSTAGRKRAAARGQGLSLSDQTARAATRVRRELEGLDREPNRDVVIAVPTKGRAQGKHTPNVRKILASMKTFSNHLDDFEALQNQTENSTPANPGTPREPPAKQSSSARRKQAAQGSRASSATARSTPARLTTAATDPTPTADGPPVLTSLDNEDTEMVDADREGAGEEQEPRRPAVRLPEGLGDVEALLGSRAPDMPSDAELRALVAGPPLTYNQARGDWDEEDRRYPVRVFCSVCGYWGRVKCVKCGTRVCALDCLDLHREGCVTRYGL
ncbi:uncharacterized protein DNG_00495 [Cephalotrichum gorgonifer]|uniref:HIT-type domain-containing protein n=1 Tax=Cephalotrichum gorgonifer TaxID=2041049 RepID=A0AAE8MQ22_9PEZI|nr:uncharacterized protein DNG_00495 [Cephalotrichum gorgonifer]